LSGEKQAVKAVPIVYAATTLVIGASAWAADTDRLDAVRAALAGGETVTCQGCNLSGANLSLADLSGADFEGANLANSDLSGASLVGANLSNTRLIGANLISADLTNADLSGANLARAFIRATRFCATVMPDGRRDDSGC
jgi:uncharacterized protein YjbI with pentapeptide repeats